MYNPILAVNETEHNVVSLLAHRISILEKISLYFIYTIATLNNTSAADRYIFFIIISNRQIKTH